jgi:formate hydrogenlyase subunit 6/NADH:ubiquinone oxidoreductase subunit I
MGTHYITDECIACSACDEVCPVQSTTNQRLQLIKAMLKKAPMRS